MLFRSTVVALAVFQSVSVSGFAPNAKNNGARTPTSFLAATREKELVPPMDLDEITKEPGKAQELYDFVQKTYG